MQKQQSQSQQTGHADEDYSLTDLEASEQMLRASLALVGGTDIDWARINLECQFSDLHIEEL